MPIAHLADGESKPSYYSKINEVIDAWHGLGSAAEFTRQGEVRGSLNEIADALDLDGFESGEVLGSVRRKINAVIDALNAAEA